MQIFRELSDLDLASAHWCADGEQFALVPTMGALHEGHLALIAEGKRHAPRVAATIFVNPLQFNDKADLEHYPRNEQADLAELEAAGCDVVWLPSVEQLYPQGFATTVSVRGVSDRWEGEYRPGHFDGVATVVAKLLICTLPNFAIFGEKDWQQLAVIRQLERDLDIGVTIVGHPTVRDADGLAMSSRNGLLTGRERAQAVALPRALKCAQQAIASGGEVGTALAEGEAALKEAGFASVDYFALVDAASLEPLDTRHGAMRLLAAATIGGTRLIDNAPVELDASLPLSSPR